MSRRYGDAPRAPFGEPSAKFRGPRAAPRRFAEASPKLPGPPPRYERGMTISTSLPRFARRLALGLLAGSLLLACGSDDPDSGSGPGSGAGNLFQFTIEGPEVTKRTATFRPTADQVSFLGGEAWFQVGAGSPTPDPVSEEGEKYGQVFFHLGKAYTEVGSYPNATDNLQIAVFPTAADAEADAHDKVIRDEDEDGVPGGLSVVVTKRTENSIEGTFTGTLNCTNCNPVQSYALTAGAFRLAK
jgi:hypothetical protein